jgi:hypothetical protein
MTSCLDLPVLDSAYDDIAHESSSPQRSSSHGEYTPSPGNTPPVSGSSGPSLSYASEGDTYPDLHPKWTPGVWTFFGEWQGLTRTWRCGEKCREMKRREVDFS